MYRDLPKKGFLAYSKTDFLFYPPANFTVKPCFFSSFRSVSR